MRILIACEESQRVCIEFRKKGHEAYSCDIIDQSGGDPEWHIMEDELPLLNGGCEFTTWFYEALVNAKTPKERSQIRSKTFPGIAKAMAEQWG